jgi:hypothetical protein
LDITKKAVVKSYGFREAKNSRWLSLGTVKTLCLLLGSPKTTISAKDIYLIKTIMNRILG